MSPSRRSFQHARPVTQVETRGARPQIVAADRPLLTTEQVRVKLGKGSINAVYRLVREERLPRIRVGNCWRFDPDALDRWLAEQQPVTTQAFDLMQGGRS